MPSLSPAADILAFWFGLPSEAIYGGYRKVWFVKDPDFDAKIRQQFLADVQKAASGEYDSWLASPTAALALLLLFDQFPRNLYRGTPRSFATDTQALSVAEQFVNSGADKSLIPAQRFFVYVPFEHSEKMEHQNRCVALMQQLNQEFPDLDDGLKGGLDYAIRHQAVIERFGRFPHRNEILGRQSTSEEITFLQQPGSRF
ncbi:MAG: DUF924 family protein [Phormidesmis sp.]